MKREQVGLGALAAASVVAALMATAAAPAFARGQVGAFLHPEQVDTCGSWYGDLDRTDDNGALAFSVSSDGSTLQVSLGLSNAAPNTTYSVDVTQCADNLVPSTTLAGTVTTTNKGGIRHATVEVPRVPNATVFVHYQAQSPSLDPSHEDFDFWSDLRKPFFG